MANVSVRRLGLVVLAAVLLTGALAWRLQAGGLMVAMFDSSSSPVSPIVTPTPTSSPTPPPTPTPTPVPPPIVLLVVPDHGNCAAPCPVIIRGAYFQKPPTVTIGAAPLDQVNWVNHTEIEGEAPAGLALGVYPIRVCNPDGQCGQLDNAFTVVGDAPILTRLVPSQGRNSAPNEVAVHGFSMDPGIAISVANTALLDATWVSGGEVRGIVPAGLPGGVHDVTASNPGVPGVAVLAGGYTALDPSSDDFFLTEADIWTDPATLRQGQTSVVLLGANVHRQGGAVAQAVDVRFFLGDPAAGGTLLGAATTVPMAPEIGAVEPVFITWDPGDRIGALPLYVQVDPDDLVDEANEANNVARRDLTILPPASDVTPPSIVTFGLNEGAQGASDPTLRVAIKATDDSSGVYAMYLVEQAFNATANMWLAVQHTGWIPFQGASLFTLTGPGGARYIQVWVSDRAGNVTALPSQARINYLPPSDTVLAGQVRVFRFTVAAGEQLTATLATLNAEGDADLYVWGPYHPGGRDLWYSDSAGTLEDAVSLVAPEAGEYDVEVHGWNPRSEYRLTVALGGPEAGLRLATAPAMAGPAAKPVPSRPADALGMAPVDRSGVPAAPIAPPGKVHLPLIVLNYQAPPPPRTYPLYLPLVMRDGSTAPVLPHKILLPLVTR